MPPTQYIAASSLMSGSRQCTGSRASVHHSPWYEPAGLYASFAVKIKIVLCKGFWREQEFRVFGDSWVIIWLEEYLATSQKSSEKKQESQGIRRNPGRNEKQSDRNWHSWNRKMQPSIHGGILWGIIYLLEVQIGAGFVSLIRWFFPFLSGIQKVVEYFVG